MEMEFDPDWFDEEYYKEYCNIENEDLSENENLLDGPEDVLDDAAELGLALGFGDFISNERLKEFPGLAQHIRKEHMSTPITFTSVHAHKKRTGPKSFERFVEDLCKGKISIDDEDY